jgi:integrase
MRMIGAITIRSVDGLAEGDVLWDAGKSAVRGFGVRRQRTAATYVVKFRIRGRQRFLTIGHHGSPWTPDTGRKEAKRILGIVASGVDPCEAQHQHQSQTLRAVIDRYLAATADHQRPKTRYETKHYLLDSWMPLHGMDVFAIRRRDVAARVAEIASASGNVSATRARSKLSALFNWCIRDGWELPSNPVAGSNCPPNPKPRERVLTPEELRAVWGALPDGDYGAIVRLLILTGQRCAEVGGLRWSEINGGVWTIPGDRCKNHHEHHLPLSPLALRIIEAQPRRNGRDLIFGIGPCGYKGWSRSKDVLDARIAADGFAMQPYVLHDLRRSMATMLVDRLGVLPHIVEAILNHQSGHRSGVAGIYNRAKYVGEMRSALDKWAIEVAQIVRPKALRLERVG